MRCSPAAARAEARGLRAAGQGSGRYRPGGGRLRASQKAGPDRFVGLCPFHSEKSGSFSVHARLQIFKCFGCGKGGDVFSFLMDYSGLSFVEALHQLAEQHGIAIPKRREGIEADDEAKLRDAIYRAHEVAQQFYTRRLFEPEGAEALAYLRRRGLNDDTIASFGIGYAPPGNRLVALLKKQGFSDEALPASGLAGVPEDRQGSTTGFAIE
jgi:DNA primase